MRTCLGLFCAPAFIGLPFFFAYLEAERLLRCGNATYRCLDPWLHFVMILSICVISLGLPWMIALLGDEGPHSKSG